MAMFQSHGVDGVTMEAIADASGVSKRTLYSYFPAKEAIVSAHWLGNVDKKTDMLPQLFDHYADTRSRLVAVFLDAATGFKSSPELAQIHFRYQFQQIGTQRHGQIPSEFTCFLAEVIEAGKSAGEVRTDMATDVLALQLVLNFTAVCLLWFPNPDAFSLDERLTGVVECFLNGVAPRG